MTLFAACPFPPTNFSPASASATITALTIRPFKRLTFCLLGVATPSDLIQDTRISPFNIGWRIELRDFTSDEAAPLAGWLEPPCQACASMLQRVLHWTGGHPYLTQRLCRAVLEALAQRETQDIPARQQSPHDR